MALLKDVLKKNTKLAKSNKPVKLGKVSKHDKMKKDVVLKKHAEQKLKTSEVEVSVKTKRFVMPSKYIQENIVAKCLSALEKLAQHQKKENRMFEEETPIFAEIHCIKIQNARANIKFVLPHSTAASSGEVCLITPDIKKGKKIDHEPTIDHWEELLRKADVKCVKTVLPMRQLRVEYDQFELKRRLLTQHDFIMVDTRVMNHVSHLLGKMFFKKHNMIIPVKINEKNLKKSIDTGLKTAMLRLNIGETSTVIVGNTGMPQKEVKENVLSLVQQLKDKFPGGEQNIRSIFLKLPLSLSLPIYVTLRSSRSMHNPKITITRPKHYMVVEDELSTIPGSRVAVAPDGTVKLTKYQKQTDDSDEEITDTENEEEISDNEKDNQSD